MTPQGRDRRAPPEELSKGSKFPTSRRPAVTDAVREGQLQAGVLGCPTARPLPVTAARTHIHLCRARRVCVRVSRVLVGRALRGSGHAHQQASRYEERREGGRGGTEGRREGGREGERDLHARLALGLPRLGARPASVCVCVRARACVCLCVCVCLRACVRARTFGRRRACKWRRGWLEMVCVCECVCVRARV